ncbi:MAG: dihydrofolate reductase [Bdellovibrionales bacterium]|nr:dihydrofolate reductase [Bdellovibrionales bacterium]
MAKNRVIGRDGKLPWHLPEDLQWFRSRTLGKPVIMGRKTYESLGNPLPKRLNVVITRDSSWRSRAGVPEGVHVTSDIALAVKLAQDHARAHGLNEIFVIGGGEIYGEALKKGFADQLDLTEVDAVIDGDASFPEFPKNAWREIKRDHRAADSGRPGFDFVTYEKNH